MSVSETGTKQSVEGPGLSAPHDAADVLRIFQHSFPIGFHRLFNTSDDRIAVLEAVADWSNAVIARDNGLPCGILGLRHAKGSFTNGISPGLRARYGQVGTGWRRLAMSGLDSHEYDPVLLIDGIAVDPAMRRGGIGRALINAAMGEVARRGLNGLRLDVDARNEGAIRFYRALGFTLTREREIGPSRYVLGVSRVLTFTLWR
ncbi:GNAT family N-acetyltransferase [Pontivivens insulae]|uniref:Ribosomal-protein-alanine acetyltransferase n=1 Tax=Pontivivens insulae TaxID=1639689 RepID=A0A2R8AFJ7_9RHOB|nr:GNAT family N-acetyltransferase [Pontivivens insulae]RED12221.1 acetyltransferase (GNAT) family protein [Pontivivens insulae]SPF30977.1 Ribosomal-protein-alanine acetyltransferase [Pontivivens insulae]